MWEQTALASAVTDTVMFYAALSLMERPLSGKARRIWVLTRTCLQMGSHTTIMTDAKSHSSVYSKMGVFTEMVLFMNWFTQKVQKGSYWVGFIAADRD